MCPHMRVARLGPLLAVLALCGALALAGCGKGAAGRPSAHGGPTKAVAAVAAGGAVSVVTRNTTRLGGVDVRRKGSTHGTNAAIEREFAEEDVRVEHFSKKCALATYQTKSHWQIEGGAFLANVSGG